MVVAQIPLWIQHSTEANPGNSAQSSTLPLKDPKANPWTDPRRSAIYAVDIAGSRIATGGGDGFVRIWSINALFSTTKKFSPDPSEEEKKMGSFSNKGYASSDGSVSTHDDSDEVSASNPSKKRKRSDEDQGQSENKKASRLLCKISSHSGSVLALRFSTSGKILASAGDDSHVIIYTQASASQLASIPRGNLVDDSDNLENWKRVRICRGHNLDVVGLAWAPDDSHLISCSLDSDAPICVWRMDFDKHGNFKGQNTNNTVMSPYKTLGVKEHTSTVKGVAFDPAGKYIASSGDDPSLCIWRAFDDWGLENKVDSSSGIFQQDVQSLANLSMFRRISFAPDGTHVCATNAMLRKKNIAAMVSREGWGVSARKNVNVSGAANLVGHKQPVVSSRHCPYLFGKKDGTSDDGEDVEPEYSTLIAIGDKKGFLTVWSTKRSKPIFKLQCSESRCAITDIAWGTMSDSSSGLTSSVMLVVSLLDGFTVALKFDTENEIGTILSDEKKNKVFRLKYGIDLSNLSSQGSTTRRLVDDTSGPKLIENVLQFEMEEQEESSIQSMDANTQEKNENSVIKPQDPPVINTITNIRKKQIESRSKKTGKRRIQPVLMSVGTNDLSSQTNGVHTPKPMVENTIGSRIRANGNNQSNSNAPSQAILVDNVRVAIQTSQVSLPVPNQAIYSVNLFSKPTPSILDSSSNAERDEGESVVASCSNSIQSLPGTTGSSSCATISISRGTKVTWRDHIMGAHCCFIDACSSVLAVGSFDGSIYLYSTSPTSGWKSGHAFRSHPPFVMDGSIIHLSLKEVDSVSQESSTLSVEMLVVTAQGTFYVFSIVPELKIVLKGSILPAMNQMRLSALLRSGHSKSDKPLFPELARFSRTDSGHLLLVLCHKTKNVPVGGLLQGFIYNQQMESWMRVSDGRFVFSKFYSTIPSSSLQKGILSQIDQVVRTSSRRHESSSVSSASEMYFVNEDDKSNLQSYTTKSHCEDRLACALVLESKEDFEHWVQLYARVLSLENDSSNLRLLIDMLLHEKLSGSATTKGGNCWWIAAANSVLGIDKVEIIKKIIIPEMTKNRSLQRLTNEITTELNLL